MRIEPLNRWPDVQRLLVGYLGGRLLGVTVATATDVTLVDKLPLLRPQRIPGGSADWITEESIVDLTAFAADEGGMWDLAARAHSAMLELTGSNVVDTAACSSSFGYVSYSNPGVWRAEATYRLTTRAQSHV